MNNPPVPCADALALFAGPGDVRALARSLDWSATVLGPTAEWSPALRTMARTIFDSPFPICLWSGPEYALIYNDAYRRILAAKHPASLGQPGAAVWAEIWEELRPQFDGVRAGGEPVFHEDAPFEMARLEDGGTETAWFSYSLSALRDEDGSVAAVLNITPETTDRIQIQQRLADEQSALALSEERLRLAVDNAEVGFWDVDLVNNRLIWPPLTKAMFGIAPDTPVTMEDFYAGLHPDDRDKTTAAYLAAADPDIRALYDVEYRTIGRKDGDERWVAAKGRGVFDEAGRCLRVAGTALDITARKTAEARRETEAQRALIAEEAERRALELLNRVATATSAEKDLAQIVQLAVDAGVELTRAEFGAFFYNVIDKEGESYMLYTLSGVPRSAFEQFPMPRNTEVFAPTFDGEGIVRSGDIKKDPRYGHNAPRKGMPAGHLPVTSYLAVPVFARDRSVIGGLFFGHAEPARFSEKHEAQIVALASQTAVAIENADLIRRVQDANETLEQRVSERTAELTEAHDALRQAQKMEAVGQLTGGIAHDFNNLLAGISGSLEIIERRLSEGRLDGLDRFITGAQTSAQRAAALTQRLLAFSRRQTLDPKPTDVNRLVFGMEDLISRTVGPAIKVEVVGAAGLWATKVDPTQLESALLNLAINARDAMPEGGRLTIETANKWLDERSAQARDLTAGQFISICVTDSGTGIPKDIVDRIFDPFFTTKPIGQGTGLGLSMIHGFVRQSGGQVRVYTEPGQGTTMCVYLPRYTGEVAAETAEPAEQIAEAGAGQVVLVIDDEPTVRMLIVETLLEAGYSPLEADDGPSGLKVLQSDARVDLLITDVGLPGGMNGRQVADAARAIRPELKVLFVTGFAENAAVGNGHLDAGMEVITKPFLMSDLANRITDMLEG